MTIIISILRRLVVRSIQLLVLFYICCHIFVTVIAIMRILRSQKKDCKYHDNSYKRVLYEATFEKHPKRVRGEKSKAKGNGFDSFLYGLFLFL